MYFKLHLWLHINKTFIKIYFKHKHSLRRANNTSFSKICSFRAKTHRISLVFEIGHEGTKLITFTTEQNFFKGNKILSKYYKSRH